MVLPSLPSFPATNTDAELPLVAADRAAAEGVGALLLAGPDRATLLAAAAHLSRRARMAGRRVAMPLDPSMAGLCREVARKLGVTSDSLDPSLFASKIASAADRSRAVVLLPLFEASAWDAEVARALTRTLSGAGHAALLVVLEAGKTPRLGPEIPTLTVEARLSPAELSLVWEGLAFEGHQLARRDGLAELQGWWAFARDAAPSALALPETQGCRRLLDRLALGKRAWSLKEALELGPRSAIDELSARGLVALDETGLSLTHEGRALACDARVDADDLAATARVLGAATNDPFALARAAELLARLGDADSAEATIARACSVSDEPFARADVVRAWRDAIELLPRERRVACRLRAAESALARGDADAALAWAKAAADEASDRHEVLVLLGRAALSRGDLVAAQVAFDRAMTLATGQSERARVALDLAEARYAAGELDAAERYAGDAFANAEDAATRLGARNTLGKLLLARARWAEAEAHFAADEIDASSLKDGAAVLRARLNRAIAVLSSGRNEEARDMLEGVLSEGEARGETRAVAFALSNLAVLATLRHDYAGALRCSEKSIEVRRRLGDKIGLARAIINLAELRLRLGLVDEAEQALAFAKQAMSPGMPASRVTEAALVAGNVHLARGRTLDASRELGRALSHASATTDGEKLSECHRLGARIALEDGDVSRARLEVVRALELAASTRARAEATLLDAMTARAAGEDAEEIAKRALALGRQAGDENLLRETYWLLFELSRAREDAQAARSYLELAIALRDQVAGRLPPELRRSYLGRRDLSALSAAENRELASLPEDAITARDESPLSSRDKQPARMLVGDDPAIVGLLHAVRKVARSDSTILIHGESGTGKELVAEAIHAASARAGGPLVKVNCAALVETLLLSELFGHERGAFTGAAGRRRGRFEIAEGGTLFLDEIGDISPRTQVALLRVLEQRTFERVGGTVTLRADVRIVCATHRDLRAMVERGEFREDLYYRLRGIILEVPPLRARMGDLPRLAQTLLERIAAERGEAPKRLGREALALLSRHRWPGNVRELENALRAASLFAETETIEARDLSDNVDVLSALRAAPSPAEASVSSEDVDEDDEMLSGASFEDRLPASEAGATEAAYAQVRGGIPLGDLKRQIERDCIARALEETRGNITRAAALLGMKRPRLSQLVKQYNLGIASEVS